MKYLLILFLSVSITEANDIIYKRESQVTVLRNTLKFVNKVEYSFGDAEGEINYFQNNDGTKKRIIKKNDGGSYGSGTSEYFAIEDKLIYYKVLEHSWLGDTTNRYSLSETIYYFSIIALKKPLFKFPESKDSDLESKTTIRGPFRVLKCFGIIFNFLNYDLESF